MKTSKKLFESLIFLFFTVLLLITTTIAWFTSNNQPDVDDFVVPVGNYDVDIKLEVKKNDGEYITVLNGNELDMMIENAVPNEKFSFRLTMINQGTLNLRSLIRMVNIQSENDPEEYDIRNVLCLNYGEVFIDGNEITLTPNSTEPVVLFDQTLSLYRLNNYLDNSNSIFLATDVALNVGQTRIIEFVFCYDQNTSDINYGLAQLLIESITIYFNTI